MPNMVEKLKPDSKSKKTDNLETNLNSKKNATAEKKGAGDSKANQEKKKVPETELVENAEEVSVSLLNIQVGLICMASKHPSVGNLLVEEIDLGDSNLCQVVCGFTKYYNPDDLINCQVVVVTNVKPGKLRDVMSAGLVLCASNQDRTEPLLPPEGAKLGKHVSFARHHGKLEDVLNLKKKQLEKITPHLHTDDKGIPTFNGVPFMISAGAYTSSIPNTCIK